MPVTDRTIILHYHLFKNAGTSFDGILRRNFPGRWETTEFPNDNGDNSARVAEWIASKPEAVAFSSHTANGPIPVIPGVKVISALFLRDPVARIRSAYMFERIQASGNQGDPRGVQIAKAHDFGGYVRARIAHRGDRQCRDFHVARLSMIVKGTGDELDRATEALGVLSFVGEVERFNNSMARFQRLVAPIWPRFDPGPMHLNRSPVEDSPVIEPELMALLEANNALDATLIERARATVWAN